VRKVWKVAAYEYQRHVLRKSFILVLLSVPAIIALMVALGALSAAIDKSRDPVGYVDNAGLLDDPIPAPQRGSSPDNPSVPRLIPLLPFATEEEAQEALENKEIQAYYVVATEYYESNQVELVYLKPPSGDVTRQFWDFMQINRLRDLPPDLARRAVTDSNLIVRWPDNVQGGGREFSQSTFFNMLLPLLTGIVFVFLFMTASGYLMGAVVDERESRTMEVVITSLSPGQLMTGKILGIVAIALTQLASWIIVAGLVVAVGRYVLDIEPLQNLSLDMRSVAIIASLSIPAFVTIAALMTAVGATVAEAQEAQQVTALFLMPFFIPMWLGAVIVENPGGPLAVGLSLFPPTSVATFSLRLGFAPVPAWQIATSAALISLTALGAVWIAGRAFRLGMLRYGQRLNWRILFSQEPS
jgi:ABC-2 type transport system permease protein